MPNDQSWNVAAPRLAQNISLLAAYVALAAPAISASAASSSSITISLSSPVNGATSYTIERSADGVNWAVLISDRIEADFPYTDADLDPETTYYYRAFAANETYTSEYSGVTQDETPAEQGGGGGGGVDGPTPTLFRDTFDGRDLSSPQINNCGFQWGPVNRTSLVIKDPQDGERVVFNGSSVYNPNGDPDRDWTPFQPGGVSLRVRYPGSTSTEENRAQQDWSMTSVEPDLWFKLRWRVPINFAHNNVGGSPSNNNKFFMFWMDDYSYKGDGSTVGSEYREASGDSSYYYAKKSKGNQSNLDGDQGNAPFITAPAQRGMWKQTIGHIVAESSPGASDGTIDYWIEEWNGSAWVNRVHSLSFTGQPIKKPDSGSKQGFTAGYLFGTANSSFIEETEFLVDLFELSTESLL